eukprot:GHVP01051374.1.p1 GENE.GHVP01051374.1~~GHVP01051374.1.p1  ORF type:complete len:551 (-),score=105.45 GHVP01051374.1:151-1803(-)
MKIKVVYGTQTNKSKIVADVLNRDLLSRDVFAEVIPIGNYFLTNLCQDEMMLFVCSTTGDGDMPDAMLPFWRSILKKDLSDSLLKNVRFSVFGLGDRTYQKFNYAARKLEARLIQLGANRILECGLGDEREAGGAFASFEVWKEELFKRLSLKETQKTIRKLIPAQPAGDAEFLSEYEKLILEESIEFASHDLEKGVRKTTFKTNAKYNPGDIIMLIPTTPEKDVLKVMQILGFSENENKLYKTTKPRPDFYPGYITGASIKDIFKYALDIYEVPNREFFYFLSRYCKNEKHKEELLELSESHSLYTEKITNSPKTRLETIEEYAPYKAITETFLLNLFQEIKPRPFSVSSYEENQVALTIAPTVFVPVLKQSRMGLTYSSLVNNENGTLYYGRFLVSVFSLYSVPSTDIILVCTGVGIAPMISIINYLMKKGFKNRLLLFFGFRKSEVDFYYKKELESLSSLNPNFRIIKAPSQEENGRYVQDALSEHKEEINDILIHEKGEIFVCGSQAMEKEVKRRIIRIVKEFGLNGRDEQKKMFEEGRYRVESWK